MTTKRKITLERTYAAPLEDVWDLWTTKDGLESWWGPEGFTTTVQKLDLRVGGELRYTMTATGAAQVEFMKRAGMPLSTEQRVTYTEIVAHARLGYTSVADFIPGLDPYDIAATVELQATPAGVRMVLSVDAMHDETWTQRATMGWESQLGKLAKILETHATTKE